jgi:hypothetical protein
MLRTIIVGTVIMAAAATAAQADVYRWVDEHGSVHYSDQWVPGSQLIKTTHTRAATSGSSGASQHDAQQKLYIAGERASLQVAQDASERAVKQDVVKAREQQCKEAKDRYSKVIQARRIYKAQPAGDGQAAKPAAEPERQYLSDEEADNLRLQAHNELVEACGSGAK